MVTKKAPKTSAPQTLWEVHQAVMAVRPSRDASLSEWRKFRANAAEMYSAVADVDRPHRDEALYWANSERARADRLAVRIKAGASVGGGSR